MLFHSTEGAHGDGDPARSDAVPFDLHWVEAGNEILLCLEGELDLVTAEWFLAQLHGRFAGRADYEVRLDLSRLAFMDLAGGRALSTLRDLVVHAGGRLTVLG